MKSIGVALGVVFGCLLLALVSELYYLLWWKKKTEKVEDGQSNIKELFYYYMLCRKKQSSCPLNSTALEPQENSIHEPTQDDEFWFRPFGEDSNMDSELIRLSAPPRFLFTIKEETKEDLESEDGKSRSRRLSDLFQKPETPFLTPLASPPYFTPPLTPTQNGFNPFFEFNVPTRQSPPPTFKFLRDAEDKFCRRFVEKRVTTKKDVLIQVETTKVDPSSKLAGNHHHHHHYNVPSSSSQVLPLASSPPSFSI